MNKKEAIIINGNLGAGKSAVGKILASSLSYEFLSSGDFFRKEAVDRNLSFDILHEMMKEDLSIDIKLDEKLRDFLISHKNFVVDSRMAAHFEPSAFKVFIKVDKKIGAGRILNDIKNNPQRHSESHAKNIEEIVKNNDLRVSSEIHRYLKLYGFDHYDLSYYDAVYSSDTLTALEISEKIKTDYLVWLQK
jgi:cytidylate kinase